MYNYLLLKVGKPQTDFAVYIEWWTIFAPDNYNGAEKFSEGQPSKLRLAGEDRITLTQSTNEKISQEEEATGIS